MPGFRCLVASLLITVVGVAVGLSLYFFLFDKDEPQPTALCGSCHCITGPDGCPEAAPNKPSSFGSAVIDQFAAQVAVNPFNLTCNPYEDPTCTTSPPQQYAELGEAAVCGLLYERTDDGGEECPTAYRMITYSNRSLAEASGAMVTHVGSCGVCSTTQDLAAYLRSPDLTTAAKECSKRAFLDKLLDETGTEKFQDAINEGMDCFVEDLGFTETCARIWLNNARNTGEECGIPCLAADVGDFNNNGPPPECKLNECLRCDEEQSGSVFKRVAGRTRRRSGLLSAIARPCEDLHIVNHEPCPATKSVVV